MTGSNTCLFKIAFGCSGDRSTAAAAVPAMTLGFLILTLSNGNDGRTWELFLSLKSYPHMIP
jgi:hypothetical protein